MEKQSFVLIAKVAVLSLLILPVMVFSFAHAQDDVVIGAPMDTNGVVLVGVGVSDTPVTPEERMDAFKKIANKMIEINEIADDKQNEALAKFMASLPVFEAAGYSADGAWGRFTDGRIYAIDNLSATSSSNPNPLPISTPTSNLPSNTLSLNSVGILPHSSRTLLVPFSGNGRQGLPKTNKICTYRSVDNAVWLKNLSIYLNDIDYDGVKRFTYELLGGVDNATVDNLASIPSDCSVIALAAHGGTGTHDRKLNNVYGIYTSTPISVMNELRFNELLNNGDLIYYNPKKSNAPFTTVTELVLSYVHYAITASFIKRYWIPNGKPRFTQKPFAYFNTCRAINPVSADLLNAVMASGVEVFAGWTYRSLGEDGNKMASYVFDRLLGANLFDGDDPKYARRPFAWDKLDGEIAKLNLGKSYDDKYNAMSEFKIITSNNGTFGLLAPSIKYLMLDDAKQELQIYGDFDAQEMKAFVADKACPITYQTYGKIFCKLPKFGEGSSGDVYLTLRGNRSNHVKLTSWKGKLTYLVQGPKKVLTHEWTSELHLRGDIHNFRETPEEEPRERDKVISMMEDTTLNGKFSGEYADSKFKASWNGSVMLEPFPSNVTPVPGGSGTLKGFQALGYIKKTAQEDLWLLFYAIGGSENHETVWAWKNNGWKQISDMQRGTNMPFGPELVGGNGIPYMNGFTYKEPMKIEEQGQIHSLKMGPEDILGFGNMVNTGWKYKQILEVSDLMPEQGTAPEDRDGR